MRLALCAIAAGLLTACASTGEQLAYDPEGCVLMGIRMDQLGDTRLRPSQIKGVQTKANCTANRAEAQMAENRNIQRQNLNQSFSYEGPPPS